MENQRSKEQNPSIAKTSQSPPPIRRVMSSQPLSNGCFGRNVSPVLSLRLVAWGIRYPLALLGQLSHLYSLTSCPHQPAPYGPPHAQPHGAGAQPLAGVVANQPITQQIYIPNDMVGAIIGKGGTKINEIRHLSGSVIKINEPQENSNERLVTITGTQECNQMALYMLYARLGMLFSGF